MSKVADKKDDKKNDVRLADRQIDTDPDFLFKEAPRERKFITGSEAAREAIRRANVDVAIAYPITPQSETMQQVGYLADEGHIKDYYRAEEEYGAFSAIAGASRTGARTFTATSGPGTMRGLEVIASWPGHRLPIVAGFMARVVNAPLSIQPDNMEIAYLMNTSMIVLHAENQQDFYDYLLQAFPITEMVDVYIPIAVCCDGFFITHARDYVRMQDETLQLPARNPYKGAVPITDTEDRPARLQRDGPVQKSNFMAYNIHAVWQQEVWASHERSKKYLEKWFDGLLEVQNPGSKIMLVASGSAAAQSREVHRECRNAGLDVGLVKIRSLRPFPEEELRAATEGSEHIIVPEFNYSGWLGKEVKATLDNNKRVITGPRVFGGVTMPTELIMDIVQDCLNGKKK